MEILTHPKALTRENLEEWRKEFFKKLKRTTTRTDLDRLILAVDRREFKDRDYMTRFHLGLWKEVYFLNGKGKVLNPYKPGRPEKFHISNFEKKILDRNQDLKNQKIQKSALKEENGEWKLDGSLKEISRGGEAIVLEEAIAGQKHAVRVACFDSALFTGDMEDCSFNWHLSKDFKISENDKHDNAFVIPHHENVIAHFANCEIIQDGEVVGWITIMELCETDLRNFLKNKKGRPGFEDRKKIAIGVKNGHDYLMDVGIFHFDMKPANVLIKNGIPKLTDFGLVSEKSERESYRRMGYARRGGKYWDWNHLYAGSAGFASGDQLIQHGDYNYAIFVLILSDWNTAWTLLFKPLENDEKEKIKKELEFLNAGWLKNAHHIPENYQIEKLTGTITLKNASSNYNLDDENLTKSCSMAQLKQHMTRVVNFDFRNLTKNVLDQKDSNLCVPISVSVLLRWAIKNDLKVDDFDMKRYFNIEKILTQLTMIIYPRSLAGLNLNPRNEEKEFQHTDIEFLLKRIKNETYLHKSGWDIIRLKNNAVEMFDFSQGINKHYTVKWDIIRLKNNAAEGMFDFSQVILYNTFTPNRPLTVTGAYKKPNGEVFFHQMILDRVENDEYVLQNTLHSSEIASSQNLSLLRIDRQRRYYVDDQKIWNYFDRNKRDFIYQGPNNEFMLLTSSGQPSMNKEEFYLLPQAYSITLTPP